MKNKKVIKIIIIIVIVLLVCIIGFVFYNRKPDEVNKDYKDDVTRIVNDEVALNDLILSIPYSDSTMGIYKDAYSQDKTIINDVISLALASVNFRNNSVISNDDKKETIDFYLKEQGLENEKVFTKRFINEELVKKYDINLNTYDAPDDIQIFNINEVTINNNYVVIKYEKGDFYKHLKTSLEMTINESNGQIVVNEKAVFIVLKGDTYYVYANTDINNGQEPLKTYSYDNRSIYLMYDIVKEDFKDYNTVFRHTFRKNELGYYWYSTELVNQ